MSTLPNQHSSLDVRPLNSITQHCVQRDLNEIHMKLDELPIIFANQVDENSPHIEAAILGPTSTPYQNGVFLIDLKLSDQFPFTPPKSITFKRATMHPNVDECGKFFSDLLELSSWTPAFTIKDILVHIWARLAVPDTDSNECDPIRAHAYRTDRENFETMAREYSLKYAAAT